MGRGGRSVGGGVRSRGGLVAISISQSPRFIRSDKGASPQVCSPADAGGGEWSHGCFIGQGSLGILTSRTQLVHCTPDGPAS